MIMPEISLSELYTHMQNEMKEKLSTGSAAFVHPGTKGDEVEANWIEWLRNYLPKRYAVDKGIIINYTGAQSDQIDVVIYDTQYSYFVFHHDNSLLIPAESVYAVFEVKPNLNKEHMEYAGEKAQSVRTLYRTSAPIKHAGGQYPPKPLHEIISGILTTKSDWVSPIVSHVVENLQTDRLKRIDIVSSMSAGTYIAGNNTFIDDYKDGTTPEVKFCEKNESLVFLLLNLLKKLQDIGTVPAIDFSKYAEAINSKYYKRTRR